jgi:spore germination cell wall hydrolase CwlJ-like protein
MKAVEILQYIEKYFDRNHNLFLKFGGLFALVFFTLYIPYNMVSQMQQRLDIQTNANRALMFELQTLNTQVEFLTLSYEKKKALMTEVECLAKNIYFEAGGEPHAGKVAVAEVTMNRVKSRRYPRTVCGVVHQKVKGTCQFSWVCETNKTVRNNKNWRDSVKIAENILISKRQYGIIGNATHFHADYVEPKWAETKEFVRQIGRHLFYKG